MNKKFSLSLLLVATVLLSSCQKDNNVPQSDYSIESDSSFELISQHPNGWIKEGRFHNYHLGEDVPRNEFEYYENGYIKSAKVYSSYPQQHLYMEVSRSEDNKPLWSKYYTAEGDLWFETEYQNGLPSVKKVYNEKGTAVHSYTSGELTSVAFTTTDNSGISTTLYDRTSGTKKITIVQNGKTVLEAEYDDHENFGDGMLTSNRVPLANPFAETEGFFLETRSSFFTNPIWENNADPIQFMPPYRNYYEFPIPAGAEFVVKFATEFAVTSEVYQSIIEQYPVTEDEVLVLSYQYTEGRGRYLPPFEERRALDKAMEENPSLFELKYGNEYIEKIHYGKNIFLIGALRNMPTDENAAKEIKVIAQKRMNGLINGEDRVSTEEFEILDKVWFEVKFFSTLKMHRNGMVLTSSQDYDAAVEEVMDAESSVIQLEYTPFDHMITD
ncbi:hypothetical protein [Salegentibacter salegens]|uniref:Uncharacterized protein n=1 Tax=Salegentibacter salegens TaxID=143223 RepID=A0A1M7MMR4_9FLAO|nr:hypothetical protein [Salegentibacter salegens]PRX43250.1 hypothetical protein LY58_02419 [Salegentibacter salegens]SHM92294.1 hypothetical protein SAMN05878281_2579 [Salegentibacter salegens]